MASALMTVYAVDKLEVDRNRLIASTLDAPEEEHLLTYIWALEGPTEEVQSQVAQLVSTLLGRLSEDKLACIPEEGWNRLCKLPKDTISGYANGENVCRNDLVQVATFSAIMRLKRVKSLPYIEMWMNHLGLHCHSEAFIRTLPECYTVLRKHRDSLQHSETLLRPSAEVTTPEALLRPISGSYPTGAETGEQLLRPSQPEGKGIADRKDAVFSGSISEPMRGPQAND